MYAYVCIISLAKKPYLSILVLFVVGSENIKITLKDKYKRPQKKFHYDVLKVLLVVGFKFIFYKKEIDKYYWKIH